MASCFDCYRVIVNLFYLFIWNLNISKIIFKFLNLNRSMYKFNKMYEENTDESNIFVMKKFSESSQ